MNVDILLLDSLEDCVVLTDRRGALLHFNPAAHNLLSGLGLSTLAPGNQIALELDGSLLDEPEQPETQWNLVLRGIQLEVTRYSVTFGEGWSAFLYCFGDCPATSYRLSQLLRAVSNYVTILNLDGYVEVATGSAEAQPSDEPDLDMDVFGANDIQRASRPLEETVFHRIISNKTPVKDRLEHSKGRYITWTGTPLLDENNEVRKVVFVGKDITRAIQSIQRLRKAERQKGAHRTRLQKMKDFLNTSGLVYNSDKMGALIRTAIKVGGVEVPVMITGESGVGKDVIADVVYENSRRKNQPFLTINCAAIPENLVESELFGYEAGAFTGASAKGKPGIFEQANGGTLFLDEVGELPISVQPKLLRALQEGVITRVGGNRDIKVDIRFISATNVTNEQLHNWEDFRQDLFYRLNGVTLNIPPLRERREDILPLAYYFLNYYNKKYDKTCKYDKTALNRICTYHWPGNVRELKNSIEVAVILTESDLITAEPLPGGEGADIGDGVVVTRLLDLNEARAMLEEKLVNLSLAEYGSIAKAAKVLEVAPSTIYRKISTRKLCISEENQKHL